MIEIPNPNTQNPNKSQSPNPKALNKWEVVGFAWELGYIIALPIVAFAFLGKWVDRKMGNEVQWVTLLGIALAIATTTIWLVRRLKKYIK